MNPADHVEMKIEVLPNATIVAPFGEIDLARAPSFRMQLSEAQARRPTRLIIDLGGVPYMDSSGVATLVEAMQIARRSGGKLVLCSMQAKVRSIFEIARLDMVFSIVNSPTEGMSA
jgi:anti-sigma B factor antagonist